MSLSPKTALLSALYFVVAIILLFVVDIGLEWFLNNVLLRVMDWFNGLSLFWKIILFILGGGTFIFGILNFIAASTSLLGGLIFNKLPHNLFTVIAPFILAIANAIYYIVMVWRMPNGYDFWIVCELLLISVFIWSLSAIVIPAKEQLRRNSPSYQ